MNQKEIIFLKQQACPDHHIYAQQIVSLQNIFAICGEQLCKVKDLARQIYMSIENIEPLVERTTQSICPSCANVCCIHKHCFFNTEDLVYMTALKCSPPPVRFDIREEEPCQFLSIKGCILKRSMRPSGCNWYFCDALLEYFEKTADFQSFEENFSVLAECWLEMTEEFYRIAHCSINQEELFIW